MDRVKVTPSGQPLDDATITMSDAEAAGIRQNLHRAASRLPGGSLDSQELLTEIEVAGCQLPPRLLRVLSRFRCSGGEYGSLLIRNLPIDEPLRATPVGGQLPDWRQVPLATVVQLAAMSRLGEVIAYRDEKGGQLVQDVTPVPGAQDRQENSGTVYLELHTEDGFHPHKPDFITLLCLRPDHDRTALTLVTSASQVLPRLSARDVAILREPLFRIRISSSFHPRGPATWSAPLPAVSGPDDDPELVADLHAMEALSTPAREVLQRLGAVLVASVAGVALDAGDLLVVDNRLAAHGRTGFTARYDGTDRWLRRCFGVADLRASRAVRPAGSRVCAPLSEITGRLGRAEHGSPARDGSGAVLSRVDV